LFVASRSIRRLLLEIGILKIIQILTALPQTPPQFPCPSGTSTKNMSLLRRHCFGASCSEDYLCFTKAVKASGTATHASGIPRRPRRFRSVP
jgi:hypothetical protein